MEVSKLLKKTFDRFYKIPLADWEEYSELGYIINVEKEGILKEANTTEKYLYYFIKGSGGILLWNKNNFICTDILYEPNFMGDFLSLLTQKPTPYETLVFEDSQLFKISIQNINKFSAENQYGEKIWTYAYQGLYTDKLTHQLHLLTLSAAERYELIFKNDPYIIENVPQQYIASYLGVTPQSLCRIKKELKNV